MIPGRRRVRAARARAFCDGEREPQRTCVKGAMLAGALFKRATDSFKKLVELQELGVVIEPDNALMRECGVRLVRSGTDLIAYIARARVPMPKSTDELIARCRMFGRA